MVIDQKVSETISQPREIPIDVPLNKTDVQNMINSALAPLQKQIDDLSKNVEAAKSMGIQTETLNIASEDFTQLLARH